MNCDEVVELMQRELDGDLDDLEQARLRDHLARCPDCAALFARLQKLSNELEQLPRVVPRYSLVDAILPKLEQLSATKDGRAGTIGAAAAGDPAAPDGPANPGIMADPTGPASPVEAGDRSGPADRSEPPATVRRASERSQRLARDLWPRLAAVAAFGVLIGVWLVTTPFSEPDSASPDTEAARPMTAAPDAGSSLEKADVRFHVPDASPTADVLPPTEERPGHASAGEPETGTIKVAPGASGESGRPVAEADAGGEGSSVRNVDTGSGEQAVPESVPPKAGGGDGPGEPATGQVSEDQAGLEISAVSPPQEPSPEVAPDAAKAGIMTLKAPTEWVSPNGKWKAYVEDGVLKVANTADGNVVYQSAAREGAPVDVVWQPGAEIRVIWADDAGGKTEFVVNLATGEESTPDAEKTPAGNRSEAESSSADETRR